MHRPVKHAGTTLVETIVAIAIMTILMLSAASLLNSAFTAEKRNRAVSEVEAQASVALYEMTESIRNATNVTSPATSTTAAALTLALPSSTGQNPVVYSLSSTTLMASRAGAAAVPVTGPNVRITSLSFQNVSSTTARAVRVTFTATYVNSSGRTMLDYANTYTTTATLR